MFHKNKMILTVNGMHCENCKKKVINILKSLEEVKNVKVDLDKKLVTIYPTKVLDGIMLSNILKDAGYELERVDVIWKGTEK